MGEEYTNANVFDITCWDDLDRLWKTVAGRGRLLQRTLIRTRNMELECSRQAVIDRARRELDNPETVLQAAVRLAPMLVEHPGPHPPERLELLLCVRKPDEPNLRETVARKEKDEAAILEQRRLRWVAETPADPGTPPPPITGNDAVRAMLERARQAQVAAAAAVKLAVPFEATLTITGRKALELLDRAAALGHTATLTDRESGPPLLEIHEETDTDPRR